MEELTTEELKEKIEKCKKMLRSMYQVDAMKVAINFIDHYQKELKRRGESI